MLNKAEITNYGLGLGLRRFIQKDILDFIGNNPEQKLIEWLEIVPENYINRGGLFEKSFAEILDQNIQIIPHSVNLSIGTAPKYQGQAEYDPFLITELKKFFKRIKAPWFSDHLSCTRINGYYLQDLIPIPFTKEAVKVISDNVKFLQDEFQIPFLIENPSYYSTLVKPEMTEAEFINAILEEADCGLLLDVNNVYVNSVNQNYDALEFLKEIDLKRTIQIHIAGHRENYQAFLSTKLLKILDTHGEAIPEQVFKILQQVLEETEVKAILLERDSNFPEFDELTKELSQIKELMDKNLCQV